MTLNGLRLMFDVWEVKEGIRVEKIMPQNFDEDEDEDEDEIEVKHRTSS